MADDSIGTRSPAAWFLVPSAMVLLALAGVWRGGGWVWLGVAELPLLALVDTWLGPDRRPRAPLPSWLADGLLMLQLPLIVALWAVFAWRVGPGAGALRGTDWLGLVLSTAFVTAYGALPASHELGHRDDRLRRRVGNLLDTFLLAPYGVGWLTPWACSWRRPSPPPACRTVTARMAPWPPPRPTIPTDAVRRQRLCRTMRASAA